MDLNIRNAVKSNLQESSSDVIYQTIEDASKLEEENILPGLGVIFEVLWKASTDEEKRSIAQKVTNNIAK